MKLAIFGASSPTGKLLVRKALEQSYEVTALIRDQSRLEMVHPKLRVLCGDALKYEDVESVVSGSDAVLSALGPKGKPVVMAAESTKNIVHAMENNHVKRLVLVSVAGIAVPQDKRGKNFIDSVLKTFLRDVFVDRENQLAILNASQVDWVAVRVPRLTDDAGTGSVKAFFGKPSPAMKLARADLTDFMLKQLTSDQWLRQAPILSN
jgi:putative NADH-flavin reductase